MQKPVGHFKNGKGADEKKSVYAAANKNTIETKDSKGLDFSAMDGNMFISVKTNEQKAVYEINDEKNINSLKIHKTKGSSTVTVDLIDLDADIKKVTISGEIMDDTGKISLVGGKPEFEDIMIKEMEIDGKKVEHCMLHFELNGHGDKIADIQTEKGKRAVLPMPRAYGWKFEGWYKDETFSEDSKVTASTVIDSDLTLFAKWTEVKGFMLYFDDDPAHGDIVTYNDANSHFEHVYTGDKITPPVIVANNGVVLREGIDYSVKYSNNVNANDKKPAVVTVNGKGLYSGKMNESFYITKLALGDDDYKAAADVIVATVAVLDGSKVAPAVSYKGTVLKAKDYTVSSSTGNLKIKMSDTNPKLTIEGNGNYSGTIKDIPVIVKADKDAVKNISLDVTLKKGYAPVYNGSNIIPAITVDLKDEKDVTVRNKAGEVMTEGTDFIMTLKGNDKAGKATLVITGISDRCVGCASKTFKINPDKSVNESDVKVSGNKVPYSPDGAKPEITVLKGEAILVEGKDYKVSYSNNKKADGKGKYTISFINNYKGSKTIKGVFDIEKASFADVDVEVYDMVYTKPGKYESQPYVTLSGNLLTNKDYEVRYYRGDTDITGQKLDIGEESQVEITAKITGKGNYTDTAPVEKKYRVWKMGDGDIDLAGYKIVAKGTKKAPGKQAYTGDELKPEIDVIDKNGSPLESTAYTVKYYNNVNKGKAVIVVCGDGAKTFGSITTTFTINIVKTKIEDKK